MTSNNKTPTISVIIPSYNLSNVIQASVENIIKNIQLITNSFEIIIVNDGSVDNTLDIIYYISKKDKPIILSTGMATYEEIEISIDLINKNFK